MIRRIREQKHCGVSFVFAENFAVLLSGFGGTIFSRSFARLLGKRNALSLMRSFRCSIRCAVIVRSSRRTQPWGDFFICTIVGSRIFPTSFLWIHKHTGDILRRSFIVAMSFLFMWIVIVLCFLDVVHGRVMRCERYCGTGTVFLCKEWRIFFDG